jgi:hypothetical protein
MSHTHFRFSDCGRVTGRRAPHRRGLGRLSGAMEKESYLEIIHRAALAEVSVVAELFYQAPEMDARLCSKTFSVKRRAVKANESRES